MQVTVNMDIQNCPANLSSGYEVVTIVEGQAWHYGLYHDFIRAAEAAAGCEDRIIVEVVD